MPRKGSVVVILYGDETVLVEHTAGSDYPPGRFGYPAGFVERGESFEDAAVRESLEECGIEINPERLLSDGRYSATIGRKGGRTLDVYAMLYFYLCGHHASRPQLIEKSDETIPRWASIEGVLYGTYEMIEVSGPAMPRITDVLRKYHGGRILDEALRKNFC